MSNIHRLELEQPIQHSEGNQITKIFPNFALKSFTFTITIIQVIYFLISVIMSQSYQPSTCVLYKLGANYAPSIVVGGEIWRLLMPIMLHGSLFHIILNLFFQLRIGFAVEKYYQTPRFILIYLISGIGGNILSAYTRKDGISIGASTSLFGIFATFGCYYAYNWYTFGPGRNFNLLVYLFFVIINFMAGFSIPNIDISGHIGGFLVGGMIGFLLLPREENSKTWTYIRFFSGFGLVLYFSTLGALLFNLEFFCEDEDCNLC
ncbi:ROM1_2 [Blepharisma stoltei]|uniref:Rhomboid-like protease n=1 Tax=Blepharisma stoltei TaxID=1481888 RepID=A0AAU9K7X3_9CILI|nr:unnamed protein product [Blepharisma stoltei]